MYDLILRDATIVSSSGRQVADVAVKDGRFAYVGPRPPRRSKRELSAIGRFLMPGLIDTGAHLPEDGALWETESRAAVSGGVTSVVGLPFGEHPVTDGPSAEARLAHLNGKSWVHHGFWGLATDTNQDALVAAKAQGLLAGLLVLLGDEDECVAPEVLGRFLATEGPLGVQVMLEDLGTGLGSSDEAAAVLDAARTQGRALHWVNLSTTAELDLLDPVRGDLPVTTGVTPHHLFLSEEDDTGITVRPPIRPEQDRRALWTALRRGRIDCLASDHRSPSGGDRGIPNLELLLPMMLASVRNGRISLENLVSICAENPARMLGLENKGVVRKGADADLVLFSESELERVPEEGLLASAGWTPYAGRETAPKPELVMVAGEVVAVRGEIVGERPGGVRL